MTQTKQY